MPLVLNGATSGSTTVQATDAVTATLTLPSSTGTLISTANPQSGGVIQVVSGTIATQSTVSSTTPAATGLTVTITPKFSSSKIYVSVSGSGGQSSSGRSAFFYLYKNGSSIARAECGDGSAVFYPVCMTYYEAPATTSAITYAVYIATDGVGTNYFAVSNLPSFITVMEIAA